MTPPTTTPFDVSAGSRPGRFTAILSSTSHDLPQHRELAHKACLKANVFPIGMEQLPARDENGLTVSLEMVDLADIYIGIYAVRYGWVPDGWNVSITEIEFDRAVERKGEGTLREILIFTAHKEHAFIADDIEADKVAQEKLDKFKERAADGRMRKEFKSPEDLHWLVFQALTEFKNRQQRAVDAATVARPGHGSIPDNLPRLQPFFGRDEELAQIRDALDPNNRTWGALIEGPGGMGKTSLAVRAAYNCPPEQFERIVFVSVKNRELDDDGVRELGVFVLPGFLEMLNELSRELGRTDILKASEDERIRLLLDALRDAQALLILDNLESLPKPDRARLLTFVRRLPYGCKAILTSREPLGNVGDGFKLEQLSQDAALAMLAELAEHSKLLAKTSEAERIALYKQTIGNPLLLRWVAGQVGRGSRRSMTDAIEFLRSCPLDNDPLEFVFGDLADEFTDDETKALCALTHFTLPARVEHVATVAGCDEEQTETALRSLANRSLVVPDTEETAFTLARMVADFVRRRKPEDIAETGNRLEQRAYGLAMENGHMKFDNFPVLDAAWPIVAAALPRFLAGSNGQLQTACSALHKFLEFTGRWDEWLALSRDAEVKAVAAKDFWNAGWRAYAAGWVHYLHQQSSEVLACADRTDTYWREFQSDYDPATALHLRGLGHLLAIDYPRAIAAFREAVELFRTSSPEKSGDLAAALESLAGAEKLSGYLDDAERDYREALQISKDARERDGRDGVASSTGNLAALALDRKNWSSAEALAYEALTLSEKVGSKELIASNCQRLAKALAKQERKPEALSHVLRAIEIFTELRSPKLEEARETLAECES